MLERLMSLLGLVDPDDSEYDDYGEEEFSPELAEREERVLRPPRGESELIIFRGAAGQDRKEELGEALRKGKMIIADLRGMERESGQSLLDFLCGAAFANRGAVLRVAGGIFLASPRKTMIEEWEDENGA
ncbi:MAG: cell division protein SepF [Aminivibrio sp.]|nr:cell division protein SepF [Synergistaceae bacterium]